VWAERKIIFNTERGDTYSSHYATLSRYRTWRYIQWPLRYAIKGVCIQPEAAYCAGCAQQNWERVWPRSGKPDRTTSNVHVVTSPPLGFALHCPLLLTTDVQYHPLHKLRIAPTQCTYSRDKYYCMSPTALTISHCNTANGLCVCVCVVCVCVWCVCVSVFFLFIYLLHSMPHYTVILHALHNLRFN